MIPWQYIKTLVENFKEKLISRAREYTVSSLSVFLLYFLQGHKKNIFSVTPACENEKNVHPPCQKTTCLVPGVGGPKSSFFFASTLFTMWLCISFYQEAEFSLPVILSLTTWLSLTNGMLATAVPTRAWKSTCAFPPPLLLSSVSQGEGCSVQHAGGWVTGSQPKSSNILNEVLLGQFADLQENSKHAEDQWTHMPLEQLNLTATTGESMCCIERSLVPQVRPNAAR